MRSTKKHPHGSVDRPPPADSLIHRSLRSCLASLTSVAWFVFCPCIVSVLTSIRADSRLCHDSPPPLDSLKHVGFLSLFPHFSSVRFPPSLSDVCPPRTDSLRFFHAVFFLSFFLCSIDICSLTFSIGCLSSWRQIDSLLRHDPPPRVVTDGIDQDAIVKQATATRTHKIARTVRLNNDDTGQ